MKRALLFLLVQLAATAILQAQPQSLRTGVQVKKRMTIHGDAVRLVYDKQTATFYYNTVGGNIYRIRDDNTDTLLYTAAQHGIPYLMNFLVHDSTFYLLGNLNAFTPYTTAIIVRGRLQASGQRTWDTLVRTAPYETADVFDHMTGGLALNAAGDTVYFSNGSRGDHGEVESRHGQFPGLRNTPLTTLVFAVPVNATGLVLLKDSVWLANSGYVFARGQRNFFDIATAANGDVFAVENSGDRDHNEEMNWLRRGKHYGFPWVMGQTVNIIRYPWYDYTKDKLLPVNSYGRTLGIFDTDSFFPPPPPNVVFAEPILNLGPDADRFRDTATGLIYDASAMGIGIRTFTAHRSPLGLVFDNDSLMGDEFTGDAFVLSYTKGNMDSTKAFPPNNIGGPFLDPSEDLMHLHLEKDSAADNYRIHATRIVGGFRSPVDAEVVGNCIYVIENLLDTVNRPSLWEISLPARHPQPAAPGPLTVFPNPSRGPFTIRMLVHSSQLELELFDLPGNNLGHRSYTVVPGRVTDVAVPAMGLRDGLYLCRIRCGEDIRTVRVVLLSTP